MGIYEVDSVKQKPGKVPSTFQRDYNSNVLNPRLPYKQEGVRRGSGGGGAENWTEFNFLMKTEQEWHGQQFTKKTFRRTTLPPTGFLGHHHPGCAVSLPALAHHT